MSVSRAKSGIDPLRSIAVCSVPPETCPMMASNTSLGKSKICLLDAADIGMWRVTVAVAKNEGEGADL